jgi:DNA (cytosine-5)-methyltransferase 1
MTGTPTPVEEQIVIEGFAGPGGYSEGLKLAGFPTSLSIGIEINADACATGEKNGHRRLKADITDLDPYDIAKTYGFPHGKHDSSPCPGMSTAGKGLGRLDLPLLEDAADRIGAGGNARVIIAEVQRKQHDENSVLSLYPLWWQLALRPEWITMEQVPTVLPLWEMYGDVLRKYGYSVWTGNVNAEQYGVPQTRKRAVLMASRVLPVRPPRPTHSRFYNRTPSKLDPGVRKWVSMAEALGGVEDERFGDLTPTHMGDIYNTKGCVRPLENPSMTLTAASDNGNFRWIDVDRVTDKVAERLNNQSGTKFDLTWPAYQPAAVVAGRGLNTAPGANGNRFNGSKKSRNDGVRITPDEAMTLQSFPEHYYFEGTKTSQFQQIGNAVPPLLGEAMVRAVTWTQR